MPDFALPEPLPAHRYDPSLPLRANVDAFEGLLVLGLLRRYTTVSAAARAAAMNISTFRRLVWKHTSCTVPL